MDLMVHGMRGRLAVECDGDDWHGPEQYSKDVARERQLERCGCPVWRVRGSAFYVDPEAALEPLWKVLKDHRIDSDCSGAREEEAERPFSGGSEDGSGEEYAGPGATLRDDSSPAAVRATDERSQAGGGRSCGEPPSSGEHGSDRDVSYRPWSPRGLPDPRTADLRQLVSGVVEIVGAEGPVLGRRVWQVYARAAGIQRLRREPRAALHEAIREALREGLIVERNEEGTDDVEARVLRSPDAPMVIVRQRSDRDLQDVPPSEVATVMHRLLAENPRLSSETLYRATLDAFGLRRLTEPARARLHWIDEKQEVLIQAVEPSTGQTLH